jgi:protein-disulfide isomerase
VTQEVRVWIDPSCPWCWQTAKWLFDLREAGVLTLTWSIFSLELNASPDNAPFWDSAAMYGESLVALALARRESPDSFERLYRAIGTRLHDQRAEMSEQLLHAAADAAGLHGLVERAIAVPELATEITEEYFSSRDASVFGVPTIQIGSDKVLYGPIMATPPEGDDALLLWEQIQGLSRGPGFFELKRWPRDLRPGQHP